MPCLAPRAALGPCSKQQGCRGAARPRLGQEPWSLPACLCRAPAPSEKSAAGGDHNAVSRVPATEVPCVHPQCPAGHLVPGQRVRDRQAGEEVTSIPQAARLACPRPDKACVGQRQRSASCLLPSAPAHPSHRCPWGAPSLGSCRGETFIVLGFPHIGHCGEHLPQPSQCQAGGGEPLACFVTQPEPSRLRVFWEPGQCFWKFMPGKFCSENKQRVPSSLVSVGSPCKWGSPRCE